MEKQTMSQILDSNAIWEKILTSLRQDNIITVSGNNPYLIQQGNQGAYFYVRNLTRAYPDHSPDVYRIQMHRSARLEKIKDSSYPLIAIGYCEQFDTLCTWPSEIVKPRLNGKGNVSLYSRLSEMQHAKGGVKKFSLRNGDTISVANINNVGLLFLEATRDIENETELSHEKVLYLKIKELLNDPSDIKALQAAVDYFSSQNLDYTLSGLRQLIEKFRQQVSS